MSNVNHWQLPEEQQIRLANIALEHSRLAREFGQRGLDDKYKTTLWNRIQELRAERTAIMQVGEGGDEHRAR